MIIAMVRHGQTDFNANGIVQGRINIPLNAKLKSPMSSDNRAFSAIGRKKTEFSANINDPDGDSSSSGDEMRIRNLTK